MVGQGDKGQLNQAKQQGRQVKRHDRCRRLVVLRAVGQGCAFEGLGRGELLIGQAGSAQAGPDKNVLKRLFDSILNKWVPDVITSVIGTVLAKSVGL